MPRLKLTTPRKRHEKSHDEENKAPTPCGAEKQQEDIFADPQAVDNMFETLLGPNNLDLPEEDIKTLMGVPMARKVQLIEHYQVITPTLQSPRASGARNSPSGYLQELRVLLLSRVAETQAREEAAAASKKTRGRSATWSSIRHRVTGQTGKKASKTKLSSAAKLAEFVTALRVAISSQPVRWLIEFIEQGAIFDIARLLSTSSSRLVSTSTPVDEQEQEGRVQFEAVKCMKMCLNHEKGIQYLLGSKELTSTALQQFALCLEAQMEKTKEYALELLSVMAVFHHDDVLSALADAKDEDDTSRFSQVVSLLKAEGSSVTLRTNALTLLNSLVHCKEAVDGSCVCLTHLQSLRDELKKLGIEEVLLDVHELYNLPKDAETEVKDKKLVDLRTQLIAFHEEIEEPLLVADAGEESEEQLEVDEEDSDNFLAPSETADEDVSDPATRQALSVLEENAANAAVAAALHRVKENEKKQRKEVAQMKVQLGSVCEENQLLREGKEVLESEFKKLVAEVESMRSIYTVIEGALDEKEATEEEEKPLKPAAKPLPQRLDVVKVSAALDGVLRSPRSPFAKRMTRIPKVQVFEQEVAEHENPTFEELEESFEPWRHYNVSNVDVRGLPGMETHLLQEEIGTWRNLYEELSHEHRQLQEEQAEMNVQLAEVKLNHLTEKQEMAVENERLSQTIEDLHNDVERLEMAKAAAEAARNKAVCGRIEELEEHLREVMAENSELEETLETAKSDLEQLEEAYQNTSAQLVQAEMATESTSATLAKNCQQLEQRLESVTSRLEEAKSARELLEEEKAQLQRSVAEKDQQLAAITEQLDVDVSGEEIDLNQLKMEITNLKSSRKSLEEAADVLSREKVELTALLRDVREESTLLATELQQTIDEKESELQQLREEEDMTKTELRDEVSALEETLAAVKSAHETEEEELRLCVTTAEEAANKREMELMAAHEQAMEELSAQMESAIEEERTAAAATVAEMEEELAQKLEQLKGEFQEQEQCAAKKELERQLREMKKTMAEEKEEVRKELQAAKEAEAAAMAAFDEKKKELLEQIEAFKAEKALFDEAQAAIRKAKEEEERKEREEKEAAAKAAAEAEAKAIAAAKAAPPPPPMPMAGGGPGCPMPPPPPMMGGSGMPPPPPMMGGKAAQLLPEGCDKLPSVKLKGLQWKKIAPYKATGTVFAVAKTPDNVQLPTEELERLFCAAVPKKTEKESEEGEGEKKKASKKPVSLLDPRRAQNIAILLSSMKATYKKVRDAIISMDADLLQPSTLRQLIKLAPTAEEMDMLKSYQEQNPDAILGSAESFFLTIDAIPALQDRLSAMLFKHELTTKVPELQAELELLRSTTLQVKKAEHFPSLLKVLLHFGNFMNGGTFRGRATGFQLASILTLKDTRASEGRGTLLHFIVEYIYANHEDLVQFTDELSLTEKASRLSFSTIIEEVIKLRKQFNCTLSAVANVDQCEDIDNAPADNFSAVMTEFLEESAPLLSMLEALQESTGKEFVDLATFYGEADPARVQPNELFHILHSFRTQFIMARREKEIEEERKAREANRQAEREKRRQSLMAAAKSRNSPRVSLNPDGSTSTEEGDGEEHVVDNIFAKIRGGDFNRARRRSSIVRNRAPRQSLSYTGQMGEVSATALRRQSVARSLVCSPPGSPAPLSPVAKGSPAEDKEVFAIFNNIKKKRASRLSQISGRPAAVL